MKFICYPFIVLAILITSCDTYTKEEKLNFDKEIKAYKKAHHIPLVKSASGLYYHVTEHGSGPKIQITDSVKVSYELESIDGRNIQSLKKPMYFSLRGTNDVIVGWKEALIDKKVGDKIIIIIPPQLGYGRYKLTDIPESSVLVYKLNIEGIK